MGDIDRNDLVGSLDDMFCFRDDQHVPRLQADCLGLEPKVECSCCDRCYDEAGNYVEADSNICSYETLAEIWFRINLKREVTCDCAKAGRPLVCKFSESCKACNVDETICSTTNEAILDVDGLVQSFIS